MEQVDVQSIERQVVELVGETVGRPIDQDVVGRTEPLSNHGMQSLLLFKYVLNIEERFNVEFDDRQISVDNFGSISSSVDMIRQALERTRS